MSLMPLSEKRIINVAGIADASIVDTGSLTNPQKQVEVYLVNGEHVFIQEADDPQAFNTFKEWLEANWQKSVEQRAKKAGLQVVK